MSMQSLLAYVLKQRGPILTARVSSAKTAAKYPYWGAVRYQIVLGANGLPINRAQEAASSDRRSVELADRDMEELCRREGRIECSHIGTLPESCCADVLDTIGGYEECVQKWLSRRPRGPEPLSLADRFLRYLCDLAHVVLRDGSSHIETDHQWTFIHREGRWIYDGTFPAGYVPYGDARDAEAFAATSNQHLRRLILRSCGDRVIPEPSRRLLQADDYGQLYEITHHDPRRYPEKQVRVVCPSTGAVYWLPVPHGCQTAHQAVAATFGLTVSEYVLAAEA